MNEKEFFICKRGQRTIVTGEALGGGVLFRIF
jgi:hypothetical protein